MPNRRTKPNGSPLRLTLREAFERYYDKSELCQRTISHYNYCCTRWERFTDNPPVGKITTETLEKYRDACIKAGLSAVSINNNRRQIRAIFRRLGPQVTGCPHGLGIVSVVPYMKPCRVERSRPKRIELNDLSRFYIASRCVTRMVNGSCGVHWWQALAVVAYFTGLRKCDLFAIKRADINLDKGEIWHKSAKTMKADVFPLHPIAVEHIRRIWNPPRERLFETSMHTGGDLSIRWNRILEKAKVERFTLHDIRRTAASEIERVKTGMGPIFLQHVDRSVTNMFYINRTEELRECIAAMRVPIAFAHGPKQAKRAMDRQRKELEQLAQLAKACAIMPPDVPKPTEWTFFPGGFQFRGYSGNISGAPARALQLLAMRAEPVPIDALARVIFVGGMVKPECAKRMGQWVSSVVSDVRDRLRSALALPWNYDPVPCMERGKGGKWMIYLPGELRRDGAA